MSWHVVRGLDRPIRSYCPTPRVGQPALGRAELFAVSIPVAATTESSLDDPCPRTRRRIQVAHSPGPRRRLGAVSSRRSIVDRIGMLSGRSRRRFDTMQETFSNGGHRSSTRGVPPVDLPGPPWILGSRRDPGDGALSPSSNPPRFILRASV
ncbi:hypothetical protein VFPFJ_01487 [Purpureocillium lilacinum]|uniref:Uncharacterized protein n=1 Tax=Purpureocillium lilacinum TaxID=33203 RepID=A0A179HY89_PURLI|nr:hypothetical protein VFPFJ_01487 [Purpureocillium lilacinum]OAQ95377.1 hypothetical protein VFPFJ_01487 [Purpureocillium lilacinum]